MTVRQLVLVVLVLLVVALIGALVLATPWRVLPTPVPGGAVPIDWTRDFTAAEQARAAAYAAAVRLPGYLALGLGLALSAVLGLMPAGARIVAAVARPFGGGWVWQVLLGGLALLLLGRLLTLPLAAWQESVRRSYGLSTRSWLGWIDDVARGFAISSALTLLVLFSLVALARWVPRWWWVPASVGAAALVLVVSFAYPLVVEPVFNRFTPMPAGPLRTSLLELAERDGVPVDEVLVADASRRTSTLNAYVSGLGSTRRIVVYDTLLESAPAEEVELIVAHELGHAKNNDVLKGSLLGALGAAAAVCVLYLAMTSPVLQRRAGVASDSDPRIIALVLLIIAVLSTVTGPVQNLVSRRVEARADVSALNLTEESTAFAEMQRRLALRNLSDLDPPTLVYGLFASHPTAPERMALSRNWARAADVPPPPNLAPQVAQ